MQRSKIEKIVYDNYYRQYNRVNKPFDFEKYYDENKHIINLLPKRDLRILEVGCGEGRFLALLRKSNYKQLVGLDICKGQLEKARKILGDSIELVHSDVLSYLDCEVGKFDVILMFDLIEHIALDEAYILLEKVRWHLEQEGQVFIRTPNMATFGATLSLYHGLTHKYGYTEWSLVELLDAAGFTHWQFIHTGPRGLYGKLKRVLSYSAHKWVYWLADRVPPRVLGKNLLIRAWITS